MGTTRREIILDAALSLVAREGLGALTHRGTDAAAGLPPGSTSYYFRRKADLLQALIDRLAERLQAESEVLKTAFTTILADQGRDAAFAFVADELVVCAHEDRDLLIARLEIMLAASRDPALSGASERLAQAAMRPMLFYVDLLAGHSADPVRAMACAALLDGLMLPYATGHGAPPTAAQVRAACSALLD
ncbi:TetR/AcrR family transcriptional regulator [Frigidibacter sp.]|uniref:TetR/AcrR family transcriptional regulator n=1 Tax=Frigidibacter sp. TaxID=2586418 RepID=UPI0027361FBB|nr:TetR family transcriptional regulator [Frigidibacter sp.]MDP3341222.1 TetR family transcriptional regulator [Frigidibacter sp.]